MMSPTEVSKRTDCKVRGGANSQQAATGRKGREGLTMVCSVRLTDLQEQLVPLSSSERRVWDEIQS